MIDAAESLFVPAAVRNNSKGDDDEAVRKAFEEPAWNNPVVRVVDHEKKDVVPRLPGDYSLPGLLAKMKAALEAREQEAPLWFTLFEREAAARTRGIETAVFGMG